MGYSKPGVRTGDGPAKGSFQRKTSGGIGKRRAAGQKCPKQGTKNTGTKKRS